MKGTGGVAKIGSGGGAWLQMWLGGRAPWGAVPHFKPPIRCAFVFLLRMSFTTESVTAVDPSSAHIAPALGPTLGA